MQQKYVAKLNPIYLFIHDVDRGHLYIIFAPYAARGDVNMRGSPKRRSVLHEIENFTEH